MNRLISLVIAALFSGLSMPIIPESCQAQTVQDRKAEADLLFNQGGQLAKTSLYREAIKAWEKALKIYREIQDHKRESDLFNNIGNAYNNLGEYQNAINSFQQSLIISRQIADYNIEGTVLKNLGRTYISLGKYKQAIEFLQQSLTIAKQIADVNAEVSSLNNLGIVYGILGQHQKAIDLFQLSIILSKQIGNHYVEKNSLNNLGKVYNSLGKYQEAIDFYQQSISISKYIGDLYGEGILLNNLGKIYSNLRQYQTAIEFHQKSLAIRKQIGDLYGEGSALNNLGSVYQSLGQYQIAIDNFQRSLLIFKQIRDQESEGNTLKNLGDTFENIKQRELAIIFYKQSINIRESIRKNIRELSQEEQQSYLYTVASDYRTLADLLLKQDRILEAQQVLDLLKVQELSDYLRTVRGNSQTAQGVDLQRPEQNIIALANELNQLQQKDREGKLNEIEQQRLSQLVQAERDQNKQFNAFLDSPQIKKLITELRRNEDNQNVDIAKYRRLQKDLLAQFPNSVLLYPLILDDRLELVILNANTPPLRRTVNIKREQLNQLIIDLRAELQDSGSEDVKQTSQKLYSILIKPFENELSQLKINTIIYAPDGQLRYIPLAALYDGKQWLVEKYRVNNITAESLTAFNSKAIANPRIFAGAFGGKGGETREGFSGLPASIPEVQKITSLFPNTTSLIEKDFTKKVTADRANSHTILHLATHGELLVGTPEDSFIVFGNGEKVTIGELKDWDLKNVDLVVLSACQSGLGSKLGTGIEVLGLGYQMQAAGARVAIASLWTVDDAGTKVLMDAFYTELKRGNLSVIEALSRAQISLIKSDKFNHPRYWSAFFAIGNGL